MPNKTTKSTCPHCKCQFKSVLQHLRQSDHCKPALNASTSKIGVATNESELPNPLISEQDPIEDEDGWPNTHEDNDVPEQHSDIQTDTNHNDMYQQEEEATMVTQLSIPEDAIYNPKHRTLGSHAIDAQNEGYIKLLCFLDKIQAPNYAFDELMDLLFDLHVRKFNFALYHKKRRSILKSISNAFPIANTECIKVELESPIPKKGEKEPGEPQFAHVYRFDIKHQIKDLLADDLFYDHKNLVVNYNKPFSRYHPDDGMLDEIHSADWYNRTYEQIVDDPSQTIILPLKIYCDKTGLDPMMQRHALEPVMFSLTILSRDAQQNCEQAWRHIGFIPDLDKLVGADNSTTNNQFYRGRSVRNYHKCLDVILEPLIELQKTGMTVFLQIGDFYRKLHAYFPVALVVGDAKSNDTWCCRISHYNQPRMSRACYTPFEECNNPWVECEWVTRKEQESLQRKLLHPGSEADADLLKELRDVSTYRCWSSLFQVDFGSNPYGQFRACSVDPMHMFEGGWIAMVCRAFANILSGRATQQLNRWSIRCIKNTRSSRRNRFPRVDYSGGITKLTNIASHEWPGILLVYLLAVSTSPSGNKFLQSCFDDKEKNFQKKVNHRRQQEEIGRKRKNVLSDNFLTTKGERLKYARSKINDEQELSDDNSIDAVDVIATAEMEEFMARCTVDKFIQMCEMLLCFHAFYKQDKYWKVGSIEHLEKFDHALRTMMEQVVTTMDRGNKTNNWNIQKFHEVLHLPTQVTEYGNVCNTDASFGERGLKFWAKRPGRIALKGNAEVFSASTINRVKEHVCLRKAAHVVSAKEETSQWQLPLSYDTPDNAKEYAESDSSLSDSESDNESNYQSGSESELESELTIGNFVTRPKFVIRLSYKEENNSWSVTSETMKYVTTKRVLQLPEDTIDLYALEYYTPGQVNQPLTDKEIEFLSEREIYVYTEARLSSGEIVRAHPNYGGAGPMYDCAIIPGVLMDNISSFNDLNSTKDTNESFIGEKWPFHVPCRLISFFMDPIDGVKKALVHRCRQRNEWNLQKDSVLIESWTFETVKERYYETKDGQLHKDKQPQSKVVSRLEPVYRPVPISNIKCGIWAIPDQDMFAIEMAVRNESAHLMVVKDRNDYWAKAFL